ncbi:MFS transporter [Microbacterium sp. NPDC096154]|uniref:MFS transporter n=1 Tax=Microbacterium sp. NPDC096154 TaxID=3155549 RepID=UPI003319B18C
MAIDPTAAGDQSEGRSAPKQALRTPVFRTLLVGWTLTNVADSLLSLILAVWVTELTGSAALGGATFVALGLPAIASPFIGALADRVSRRRMLAVSYFAGALGLVPLFWVQRADQVWIVFAATLLYALISYVTGACQSGILRDMLPDAALPHANGLLQTIDQVLRIVGPVAGAGLYAWIGPLPVVGMAIGAFAAAAAVFAFVRIDESAGGPREEHIVAHLLGGFRHLFRTRPLSGMTWALIVGMGAVGLINAIVFAAMEAMGLPPALLGPINATQGVAGIVAGLTTAGLLERIGRTRVFAIGLTATGVGLLPLCFQILPLVIAGLAVTGYGVVALVIAYVTERQISTPERLQGRAAAASHVAMNLPMVATTAVGAAVVALVDYRVIVAVGTLIVLGVGATSFRLTRDAPGASGRNVPAPG